MPVSSPGTYRSIVVAMKSRRRPASVPSLTMFRTPRRALELSKPKGIQGVVSTLLNVPRSVAATPVSGHSPHSERQAC